MSSFMCIVNQNFLSYVVSKKKETHEYLSTSIIIETSASIIKKKSPAYSV